MSSSNDAITREDRKDVIPFSADQLAFHHMFVSRLTLQNPVESSNKWTNPRAHRARIVEKLECEVAFAFPRVSWRPSLIANILQFQS